MSFATYDRVRHMVVESGHELPVYLHVEVAVCGGGTAGIGAALGAVQTQKSVLLIEQHNCLGGMATSGLVTSFMYMTAFSDRTQLIKGAWQRVMDRLIAMDASAMPVELFDAMGKPPMRNHHHAITPFDPEVFKYVTEQLLIEWGVNLLYHTYIVGVIMDGNAICGVIIENKAGRQAVLADRVVDATGDGDVAAMAGAPFEKGRPEDGLSMPLTLMYRIGGLDDTKAGWQSAPKLPQGYANVFRSTRPGEFRCEMTRVTRKNGLDPDDLTQATIVCREQMFKMLDYFHNEFPGGENAYIIDSAHQIGVQDSRRILGVYVLTCEDLDECRSFEDNVCLCAYGVDVHNPLGKGAERHIFESFKFYGIPYRCLVPQKIENLLVAGRCISADFKAESAIRIMAACMATGEAAGAAAGLSLIHQVTPRELSIKTLHQQLDKTDVLFRPGDLKEHISDPVAVKNARKMMMRHSARKAKS